MFNREDNSKIKRLITYDELVLVLISFSKDKSLGPDSSSIEMFIHFMDLMERNSCYWLKNQGLIVRYMVPSMPFSLLWYQKFPWLNTFWIIDLFLYVISYIKLYPSLLHMVSRKTCQNLFLQHNLFFWRTYRFKMLWTLPRNVFIPSRQRRKRHCCWN